MPAGSKASINWAPWIFALAVVLLGGGVFWFMRQQAAQRSGPPSPPTPEAKAYVAKLKLSDVQMKATESYMKQTIIEIEGKISNNGDRAIRQLEVYCIFYDSYGQVVLREKLPVVKGGSGGLKPGDTKAFRLPFDNLPGSWNQGAPQVVIARILFE